MITQGNKNKNEFLGMPFGTAMGRLRKMILFDLVKKCGLNFCYRCRHKIESIDDFSIEHKKAWLGVDVKLFWDLDNIEFSHLHCNSSVARRMEKQPIIHGTPTGYKSSGCRCKECTDATAEYQHQWRKTRNSVNR